jgi:ribosomal protein L11 methyltransferase
VSLDPAGDAAGRAHAHERLAAADADAGALVAAAARMAALRPPDFMLRARDDDWVRRSQAQFGPIRISARSGSCRAGTSRPTARRSAVRLDPGLAFGTGSHVSTRLVLQYLRRTITARASRVLDYGCGSGILAIVAAKLGAAEIAAVDIDPQALAADGGERDSQRRRQVRASAR